jgi:hypothetical protein
VSASDRGRGGGVRVAAIKVRLIGLDFKELRSAPMPLRIAFESYCLVLGAVLSGLYLSG